MHMNGIINRTNTVGSSSSKIYKSFTLITQTPLKPIKWPSISSPHTLRPNLKIYSSSTYSLPYKIVTLSRLLLKMHSQILTGHPKEWFHQSKTKEVADPAGLLVQSLSCSPLLYSMERQLISPNSSQQTVAISMETLDAMVVPTIEHSSMSRNTVSHLLQRILMLQRINSARFTEEISKFRM